ncbi:GyrI-like domain-containing protein [Paenibacillus tarimensis]
MFESKSIGEMMMNNNQVEIITLETKHFVGVPVTVAFQKHDPGRIKEANQIFIDRKHEIQGIVKEYEYVCPHFANDVLFTYIYCMEVSEITHIPDGMIGFSLPSQQYAKVRSTDQDPYGLIKNYLDANGLENNTRSLALEVFIFGEKQHYNNADILVPIK